MTERMAKPSRDALVSEIAAAIREEIASLTVPEEMHAEHHEFIRDWIEERKRSREWRDKIKAQVGGWAIVTALGGIGTGAWHTVQYLKEHLK